MFKIIGYAGTIKEISMDCQGVPPLGFKEDGHCAIILKLMKTNRRSQINRAEKFKARASAMLEQYHWERPDAFFLAIMESTVLTIDEIRELTWAQVRQSYDGLVILDRPVPLRDSALDEARSIMESGIDYYGNELNGSDGSPRLFTKETMKNITRELDQFKG